MFQSTHSETKHICMLDKQPNYYESPPTVSNKHRFWRKFREMFLPSAWHNGTCQNIRSEKCLRMERARVIGMVSHPYSAATFYWQCFYGTITSIVLIYIPFQVFMICPNQWDRFILFTDVLAVVHIFTSFLTGYVKHGNQEIVLDHGRIARHYLTTTFFPDVIGALPLQLIKIFDQCQYPSHTVFYVFKLFRLFTLTSQFNNNILDQLRLSYLTKKAILTVTNIFLFFHWMTYIHYQVPAFTIHFFEQDDRFKIWMKRFHVVDVNNTSIAQKYIASLFLVCGLCIGAGYYGPVDDHIISEFLLTIVMGLIGLIFVTYSFSNLLRLSIYKNYEAHAFNGKCRELKNYMVFKRLPQFLQLKVQLFVDYKFNGHYFNERSIMNTINEQIKQDINMHCCKKLVMNVTLFQDMPLALINAIIFNLTRVLYMPGEVLTLCGTLANSIYLIRSGTVAVMNANGKEIGHLRDGAFFGETTVLFPGSSRIVTIIALEITEVYKLDSKDFQACLQPYPHLKRRLEESFWRKKSMSSKPAAEMAKDETN